MGVVYMGNFIFGLVLGVALGLVLSVPTVEAPVVEKEQPTKAQPGPSESPSVDSEGPGVGDISSFHEKKSDKPVKKVKKDKKSSGFDSKSDKSSAKTVKFHKHSGKKCPSKPFSPQLQGASGAFWG